MVENDLLTLTPGTVVEYYGDEEGDTCGRDAGDGYVPGSRLLCPGVIALRPVEDCSCHISPPCAACTEAPLWCPVCRWVHES